MSDLPNLSRIFEKYPSPTIVVDSHTDLIVFSNSAFQGKYKTLGTRSFKEIFGQPLHHSLELKVKGLFDAHGNQIPVTTRAWHVDESLWAVSIEEHHPPVLPSSLEFQDAINKSSIVSMADRSGTITYVNENFVSISGFEFDELIGKSHRIINSGFHSREFWINMWKTISSGKTWRGEVRNKAKNGSFYWVDTFVMPFLNPDGSVREYLSIRNDITTRKQAEEMLRESNHRLKETLEFARMGSCEMELLSDTVRLSPELLKLMDMDNTKPLSVSVNEFISMFEENEGRDFLNYFLQQKLSSTILSDVSNSGTIKVITKTGRVVRMEAKSTNHQYKHIAIFQDVSTQERAEVDLRKKSHDIENILSSISDGFFGLDKEWRFVIANKQFVKLSRLQHHDLIGKNIWEIFPASVDTLVYAKYNEAVESNQAQHFEIASPSYPDIVYDIHAYPHSNGLFVYFRDVSETKRAVTEMLKSQEQLQTIVDNIPMQVSVKDTEGRYIFYNKSFSEKHREASAERPRQVALDLLDQQVLDTASTISGEYDVTTEGEIRSMYSIRFPLLSNTRKIYGIGSVDLEITDRKRMENALRKSEERMRLAQEAAQLGVWEWNIITDEVIMNDIMCEILGISKDEPKTVDHWRNSIHPDDLEFALADLNRALMHDQHYQSEYRIIRTNGIVRTVLNYGLVERDANQKPVRMVGVNWDITPLKDAQAEQNRLNKIVQETFNEIILFRDPSLALDYINPAAMKNLGYSSEELAGMKLTDLFNYPDEMAVSALFSSLRKAETDRLQLQLKLHRKNGSVYDADVLIQILEKGKYFVAIITDITSKLITEKKLLETISEKETLIKEIHHRVKNNLQLISSILYLKLVSLDKSEIRDFLEDTRQKIRSIALIHERLLQSQSLDRVEISEYLGKLVSDLRTTYFNPELELSMHTQMDQRVLGIDAAIICGLIVNELITNSLKHAFIGRAKGSISVEFRYLIGETKNVLIIEDDGVSLPLSISPGSSPSFGMQLIDVFVKQLGGSIAIFRENGTKFHIEF